MHILLCYSKTTALDLKMWIHMMAGEHQLEVKEVACESEEFENQRETLRIQREEKQRSSRLQTEQTFLGAHQANLNARVLNNATDNGIDAFRQPHGGGMFDKNSLAGSVPQMPSMPPTMPGM